MTLTGSLAFAFLSDLGGGDGVEAMEITSTCTLAFWAGAGFRLGGEGDLTFFTFLTSLTGLVVLAFTGDEVLGRASYCQIGMAQTSLKRPAPYP